MNKELTVKLEQLYLDPNNYRIKTDRLYVAVPAGKECDEQVQKRTFSIICGDKQSEIKDLLDSFRSNGYLPVDQIQVRPLDNERYLVLEGNRRIATLKWMQEEYRKHAFDLGKLEATIFDNVPVILNTEDASQYLILMGLKHISGNKEWGTYNQALLEYDLHFVKKMSEGDVCAKLGVTKISFRQNIRSICLLNQYKESDYGDQSPEDKLPLFIAIIRSPRLREWIGWDDEIKKALNQENTNTLFSLISIEEDEDSDSSSDSDFVPYKKTLSPAITRRDEIRCLADFVDDKEALDYLIRKRDFQGAYSRSVVVKKDQMRNALETFKEKMDELRSYRFENEDRRMLEQYGDQLIKIIDDNQTENSVFADETLDNPSPCRLDTLLIHKYKCFSNLKIDGAFSRVNLFAGVNNSGKTALLEAIYLLIKQHNIKSLLELSKVRGKIADSHIRFKWLYDQIANISINGTSNNGPCSYSLQRIEDDNHFWDSSADTYLGTVKLSTTRQDVLKENTMNFFLDKVEPIVVGTALGKIDYTTPFYHNEASRFGRYYRKCQEIKQLDTIVSFLREKLVSTLTDIYWDDENLRFMVKDTLYEKSVDLSQYGEGIQRIFLISLKMASVCNGILLIDEFENAIHAGMLKDFTEKIYELAVKFNVQLFITSHSKECIDAFAHLAGNADKEADFMFYSIASSGDNRQVKCFNGKKFSNWVKMADVDLRRVTL